MSILRGFLVLALSLALPVLPAFARAQEAPAAVAALPPFDTSGDASDDAPAAPAAGDIGKQLGNVERGLKSGSGGPPPASAARLLSIVTALKKGGQGLKADDVGYLKAYLRSISAGHPENASLAAALGQLESQLDGLEHQLSDPDGAGDSADLGLE